MALSVFNTKTDKFYGMVWCSFIGTHKPWSRANLGCLELRGCAGHWTHIDVNVRLQQGYAATWFTLVHCCLRQSQVIHHCSTIVLCNQVQACSRG